MSKEAEEAFDSQELDTPQESDTPNDSECTDSESVSEPAAEEENSPLNEKILAIKSALKTQEEERQQEETISQIADKVKKYKTAKDAGETEPIADEAAESEDMQEAAEKPKKEKSRKEKKRRRSKKKTAKKRKRVSLFPRRGDSILEVFRKTVFLISSAVFVVCLCLIADYFWDSYQNRLLKEKIDNMYPRNDTVIETQAETETVEEGYEYYGYLPGAENLLAINPDIVGFISIPGTDISYPVVQRHWQEDGNDFYLNKNIELEDSHAGSIFMDYRNDFDYVIDGKKQAENSANLIVYGHNMHDYSMFGGLKHYVNDANYYSEHPIVELNSNYRKYQYKIFGFIIVDIEDQTETKFDYWNQLDFADERAFYDYVNEVKRRTIRLNDVDVQYGDELLTLSTCNSTFSNGRLVVFARKVREGEDLYAGTETSTKNPNIKWSNSYYRWHKNTYDPDAEFIPYG